MPEKKTFKRARRAKREGKSPTTQAGEFVREEMHHIREGKHGARSPKQAIAIGLSKARQAGVKLPPPEKGEASEKTRKSAERAYRKGQGEEPKGRPSAKRSRAVKGCAEARGQVGGIQTGLVAANQSCGSRPNRRRTVRRRNKGGPHERPPRPPPRCQKSGPNTRGSRLKSKATAGRGELPSRATESRALARYNFIFPKHAGQDSNLRPAD